jgi:hypothetical protein
MFSKVIKIIAIVLVVAVLATICVGVVLDESNLSTVKLVKVSDLNVPATADTEEAFGLFFYNEDGTYTNCYTHSMSELNYDNTKPIIIFVHGIQVNEGYNYNEVIPNSKGWLDAGYNVAEFFWSQFSDDSPFLGQDKVWGTDNMRLFYEDEDGNRVEDCTDLLNYSITEAFIAYYVDFLQRADFQGREIYLTGLSMGSNICYAACNYLLTLEEADKIPTSYLPDRVTFFDAYLDNMGNDEYVNWLDDTVGANGTVGRAYETVQMLIDKGIAVTYVQSSLVGLVCTLGDGEKDLFEKMTALTTYMEFNSDFAGLNMSEQHVSGKNWYFRMIDEETPYDQADTSVSEYAVSPFMPTAYTYARMGTTYTMASNTTEMIFDDDYQSSDVENPKIAGFAYFDANDNGVNDDRINNRIDGVSVSLYNSNDELVETTTTTNGGYYEFDISADNVGSSYYIKVDIENTDYTVGKEDDGSYEGMGNGLLSTGKSATVTLDSAISLKIINIGLK